MAPYNQLYVTSVLPRNGTVQSPAVTVTVYLTPGTIVLPRYPGMATVDAILNALPVGSFVLFE
eukprot:2639317-Rhodomonas_salina.2